MQGIFETAPEMLPFLVFSDFYTIFTLLNIIGSKETSSNSTVTTHLIWLLGFLGIILGIIQSEVSILPLMALGY